jgi:hypothetical protein
MSDIVRGEHYSLLTKVKLRTLWMKLIKVAEAVISFGELLGTPRGLSPLKLSVGAPRNVHPKFKKRSILAQKVASSAPVIN